MLCCVVLCCVVLCCVVLCCFVFLDCCSWSLRYCITDAFILLHRLIGSKQSIASFD